MQERSSRIVEAWSLATDFAGKMAALRTRFAAAEGERRVLFIARGQPGSKWFFDRRSERWVLIDAYTENVPDELAEWCRSHGWQLLVLYDGVAPDYSPPERPTFAERYPGVARDLYSAEMFAPFPSRTQIAPQFADHYAKTLFADAGFNAAFAYDGVQMFETLTDQIDVLPGLAAGYVHSRERWIELLNVLKPEVVFGGRLDTRAELNSACAGLGIVTVGIKLGISEEMLTPFAIADDTGAFYEEIFPDVLCVWGEWQKQLIAQRFPDCNSTIIPSGRTRSDSFAAADEDYPGDGLRTFLGAGADTRLIVYGANYATKYGKMASLDFGASCMSPESYRRGLDELSSLAARRGDSMVVVKPHPSDDIAFIRRSVEALGSPHVRLLTDEHGFHNALLLRNSAVFVSSVSSMFAEAVLSDCPAINLWTPDINYLYETARRDLYGTISLTVESWDDLVAATDRFLSEPDFCAEQLARMRSALEPIFGGLDGGNARRLVEQSMAACLALLRERSMAGAPQAGEATAR